IELRTRPGGEADHRRAESGRHRLRREAQPRADSHLHGEPGRDLAAAGAVSLIVARRMLLVVLPGLLAGRAGRLAGQGGEAVSAAVAKFVRSQHLPKPQTPRLLLAVPDELVEMFSVSYGEPQDCMVGCFYSGLSGLRYGSKIGWMDCDGFDRSRFDHPITCFDVDSTDRYLFSA